MAGNEAGGVLNCTNGDCDARLIIDRPCPHGEGYVCACGSPMEPEGI